MGTLRETLQLPFMALLLLPVCICIFTANLKSISCFAESGYNANIYVYLGQFHSQRMALPAFYWSPELCYAVCGAVDISLSLFPLALLLPFPLALLRRLRLCLRLRLRFRHDAKVLPLHATWRMRNIYLCQISLIAIQCQLRCQFTSHPSPPPLWHLLSVVFAMFTYVSFPSGLVEHIRPIWRPISALRFSERATNCRWDWQPVQLIRLSVCPPVCLPVCLPAICLSVRLPAACLSISQPGLACQAWVSELWHLRGLRSESFRFRLWLQSWLHLSPLPHFSCAACYLFENFARLPFPFPSLTLNASPCIFLAFVCVQCIYPCASTCVCVSVTCFWHFNLQHLIQFIFNLSIACNTNSSRYFAAFHTKCFIVY